MNIGNPKKYALAMVLTGVAISTLVIFVERTMISTNSHNQPYIALGEYLKNISTKAHLWFEEAMSGDGSIDIQRDVYGHLDNSVATLEAALNGGETEVGTFYKVVDNETLLLLRESIEDVNKLKLSAQSRWQFRQETLKNQLDSTYATAGEEAGGALDQEFDAAYEELQETYDRLVKHVKTTVADDNDLLNNLSWTSIVLILSVFGMLSWVLYRIQLKNDMLTAASKSKLEEETARIQSFSNFIQSVSARDFTADLSMRDALGIQLIAMRDTLKENSEHEKRQAWASTGMAQIGEILRAHVDDVRVLYDRILQHIVKYSGSNQGFLFVVNDADNNDPYLELVSAYAYDRKKFLEKRIEIGEGLVGQCYLEGETVYRVDLPQHYTAITSGLGGATPTSLLIVPLVVNGNIYGVLEMASFKRYQDHELRLIEKFGESVASSLSTLRINERTRLLLERTQLQAEEMRAQEEEMRQNMEELSATQEEMARKEREYIARIQELETETDVEFKNFYQKMREAAAAGSVVPQE